MKIKNIQALATNQLRADGLAILEAGLLAIDTRIAVKDAVSRTETALFIAGKVYSMSDFDRVRVVAIGKCAGDAVVALYEVIGENIYDGIVIDTRSQKMPSSVNLLVGSHPLPKKENIEATKQVLEFLKSCTERDLVIVVVSGGGSALLCQPGDNMTIEDELYVTEQLMRSGATIQEINIVRKHLSLARGGGLAVASYPATAASLIFSDVPGDDIAFISSGPTVMDETTVEDAQRVLSSYGINDVALLETSKDKDKFSRVTNTVIVSNVLALEAMRQEALKRGYDVSVENTKLTGEARDVSYTIINALHEARPKTALLYGGETTVKLDGSSGTGGRNQEVALAGLEHITEGELLLACASDGRDNTDVAGALCDTVVREASEAHALSIKDALARHDSYVFFKTVGAQIETGPTGSNIADIIIALK